MKVSTVSERINFEIMARLSIEVRQLESAERVEMLYRTHKGGEFSRF